MSRVPGCNQVHRLNNQVMHKLIERVSGYLTVVAAASLLFLMLITFFDVVGRFFFHAPLTFSVELTELGMGILVAYGLAITTLNRGHISIDLLSNTFPNLHRLVLARIAALATVVFLALITWRLLISAGNFKSDGLATQILYLPVYPIVYLMAAAALVATLIAVAQLLSPSPQGKSK